MKKSMILGLAVVALLIGAAVWVKMELFSFGTFRYKMTVSIETPEGIKTGSAVREVYVRQNPKVTTESLPHIEVRGEAVAVNLGKRGILFVLISHGSYREVFSAFPRPSALSPEGIRYYASLEPGLKGLLIKEIPELVYFKDLSDPKSVQAVARDNLAAVFGDGVAFKNIEIEITDEPVEISIEKLLPWLSSSYGRMLDGQRFNTAKSQYPEANRLSVGSFSTEIKKQ